MSSRLSLSGTSQPQGLRLGTGRCKGCAQPPHARLDPSATTPVATFPRICGKPRGGKDKAPCSLSRLGAMPGGACRKTRFRGCRIEIGSDGRRLHSVLFDSLAHKKPPRGLRSISRGGFGGIVLFGRAATTRGHQFWWTDRNPGQSRPLSFL